jgi:LacI family transcriptional regulator
MGALPKIDYIMDNLTLEDIAKKAGVSRSTVSRVINNQESVREEVRQRVLRIIDETGYQPHFAARSLASRRSRLIGLVIPRGVHTLFTDPYFPRLIQGISQACNQNDYTLSLFIFNSEEEEKKLYPRISRQGMLDGLIVQAAQLEDELLTQLMERGASFIIAGRPYNLPEANFIDVDNVFAARTAVKHLIQQGRKRIGTITGPKNTTAGIDRYEGYQIELKEHGLEIDDRLVVEGDFTEEGGYTAGIQLLKHNPDAVFSASDVMALGLIRAANELNLKVPEDFALVGFDDLPPAKSSNPKLTTIRQPILRLGIHLVETLLDIIDNGGELPQRIMLDTELIIRESCGSGYR